MPMFHTARRWLFLALFAAPPAAWAAGDMSSLPPLHTLTSEQPIVVCRQFPAEQIERLKAGDKQLVLVVEHYQPPRNASAGLYVTTPNRAGRSAATARIGIYPDQPSANAQQRFLLHPSEYAGAVQTDRVCLSVGFYRETELPRGGKASVGLDLADTPR
ncbi:signal peptidase [Ralstonia pseudosolanacearum]|uniref:signal peptidase n=1 Tax=Ralstonia pseudosolanacearum TaxID=1310165 RepID=UPI000B3B1253|nr:signal peptidase [Ralstonia pseudosolanacearum]MBX9430077.1 signal peptidase [Ralstonia pseudosolanacearum]MDO3528778.1 signal peptidase [Ralstonia pseudosolanacearum]MDO3533288.1 signal peptidase [Ralstonia pseudosolanacearum]MDO3624040.1 signal peptidase [Ralstonia pseudosolanacearum]